jgi:hypothetical protein
MNPEELRRYFGGQASPLETAQWFRGSYLPELIRKFNSVDIRKLLALYAGERIPDNERNLTDVRNRVSLIVEFELARLSNSILQEAGITDLFWCYVVANRFPDLEVRRRDGTRALRIEVKNLQSIAEEKSANFDTLRKDINPNSDFIVAFLWEWFSDSPGVAWQRAPKLLHGYVFHAASLAALRDTYWLNRPPTNLGGGFQGFDLRHAINCADGVYSEEEGNYGKLLRIWAQDFPYRPVDSSLIRDTEVAYLKFQAEVVAVGFSSLCSRYLPGLSGVAELTAISHDGKVVGMRAGDFGFFSKTYINERSARLLIQSLGIKYGVTMNEKYVSSGYEYSPPAPLRSLFTDQKPKRLTKALFGLA